MVGIGNFTVVPVSWGGEKVNRKRSKRKLFMWLIDSMGIIIVKKKEKFIIAMFLQPYVCKVSYFLSLAFVERKNRRFLLF